MNVYEAIKASPIGYALHMESRSLTKSAPIGLASMHQMYPDGWQPLAVLEQYQLGEPLTEATVGQSYIAVHKSSGAILQGQFVYTGKIKGAEYTYYADPRPWPVLPEKKEEQIPILAWVGHNRYQLTAEGAARLEKLLRESEGE